MRQSDYNKFKLSKPWGYFPPDVDRAIDEYESALGKLNAKMSESMMENQRLKGIITRLEDELRALHIEMSSIELPDTEEIQETVVLQEFRQYPNGNMSPPVPVGVDQHQDEGGIVDMESMSGYDADEIDSSIARNLQLGDQDDESNAHAAPVGNRQTGPPERKPKRMKLGGAKQAPAHRANMQQKAYKEEESEGMSDLVVALERQGPSHAGYSDDLPQRLDPSQMPAADDQPFDGIQGRVRMKRQQSPAAGQANDQEVDDEPDDYFNIVM